MIAPQERIRMIEGTGKAMVSAWAGVAPFLGLPFVVVGWRYFHRAYEAGGLRYAVTRRDLRQTLVLLFIASGMQMLTACLLVAVLKRAIE